MAIAIVDDTPINLTLIQALVRKLTPAGMEIVCFTSPLEGLQWCSDNEPDLVIVDYMMPDINGIEFIEAVRKLHPSDTVPILMVTAAHEKEVRYQSLTAGANDFLTKPIDRHEFDPRVRTMLKLRESQKQMRNWKTTCRRPSSARLPTSWRGNGKQWHAWRAPPNSAIRKPVATSCAWPTTRYSLPNTSALSTNSANAF